MVPSRRSVLKRGLFGGALLFVGGGGLLALRGTKLVPVPDGLKVCTSREYSVLTALVDRFHPPRPGFPSAADLKTAVACDGIMAVVDATALQELKQLLMLFENALANFLFGARTTPFTQLSAEEQDAVLREWQTSSLTIRRTGYLALRSMVNAAYYGAAPVWPAVGYPGPIPGIHNPHSPVWKGGGEPRPPGNGIFTEPEAVPAVPEGTP